ncbi:hypothetical protein [Deinococcus aquatilis]|uniref:hypothetical protein n=1 Tax=Deinococcus aquatilis TaxID=519440 RepID=UPI00035D7A04|nr:hypothetical protein [Deinococcus aquatilis]
MTTLPHRPTRDARLNAIGDKALSLTEFALRQQGYTHAVCVCCGYQQPLSHYLYSGDRCPGIQADDSACDGTLMLSSNGGAA